jgi:acyl-coenzyme A thioesterase PaaI-like protein
VPLAGGGVRAGVVCPSDLEGYEGVVHGGVVCALLDGAMANALFDAGLTGRTAKLAVRFVHPLRTGVAAEVTAIVVRVRGRLREARAEVVQNGAVAASATATFLEERAAGAGCRAGDAR